MAYIHLAKQHFVRAYEVVMKASEFQSFEGFKPTDMA